MAKKNYEKIRNGITMSYRKSNIFFKIKNIYAELLIVKKNFFFILIFVNCFKSIFAYFLNDKLI
jgi:hypothetical protein